MSENTKTPASHVKIPASNVPMLEDRLAKMNKRAAKLGLAPVTLAEVSREARKVDVGRNSFGETVYQTTVWVTLDIRGDKPTVPGWTLIGAIDHQDQTDGSVNVLRSAPGEEIPESYRKARPTCDHCASTRRRRDTFILRSEGDTHTQIGRNCLQDFLGEGETAAQIAGWLKYGRDAQAMGEECGDEMGRTFRGDYEATRPYLAAVAAEVRVSRQWVSRARAYDTGGGATADAAWSVLYPESFEGKNRAEQGPLPEVTPDDIEFAQAALAWIRDLPESDRASGYMANLWAACALEGFRNKSAGLVASLVGSAFPQAVAKATEASEASAEAAAKPVSAHVGDVKERLRDMPVTIEKIRGWEGDWGYTTLVVMRDASNNLLVWFASGDLEDSIPAEGETGILTGTVKAHSKDKRTGEASTTVRRCKLLTVEAAA